MARSSWPGTGDEGSPDPNPKHDSLVTLRSCHSTFEAHSIAAVLDEHDIECVVFDAIDSALGLPGANPPIQVQVRMRDLDRASRAIENTQADSVDIDWDEVDVGVMQESVVSPGMVADGNRDREPIEVEMEFGVRRSIGGGVFIALIGLLVILGAIAFFTSQSPVP